MIRAGCFSYIDEAGVDVVTTWFSIAGGQLDTVIIVWRKIRPLEKKLMLDQASLLTSFLFFLGCLFLLQTIFFPYPHFYTLYLHIHIIIKLIF